MVIIIPLSEKCSKFSKKGYYTILKLLILGTPMILQIIKTIPTSYNYFFNLKQENKG